MLGLNMALGVGRIPLLGPGDGGGSGGVQAVHWDGTNDWMQRGAALTGAVAGENLLASLWFLVSDSPDGENVYFVYANNGRIRFHRDASNKITLSIFNSTIVLWKFTSTNTFTAALRTGWHHLLIAAELDVTPVGQVYLDDAVLAGTDNTGPLQGDIDWPRPDWGIGNLFNPDAVRAKDLAEVWFDDNYLDISIESNRRKFIDAAGKPADLGETGQLPLGAAPLGFFSGPTVSWHTNKGTGGGFTMIGALSDAPTSPSD